jgi:hypothetical protein
MSDESVPQHPSPHRTLHHVSDMLFGAILDSHCNHKRRRHERRADERTIRIRIGRV